MVQAQYQSVNVREPKRGLCATDLALDCQMQIKKIFF